VFSLDSHSMQMERNYILRGPFKRILDKFSTNINSVMYAYIDRKKKKLPITTLFRAIGFEETRVILEIFDLEEIKVSKRDLKKYIIAEN
jgi:DNA-directed RNA polymerase subunit beta